MTGHFISPPLPVNISYQLLRYYNELTTAGESGIGSTGSACYLVRHVTVSLSFPSIGSELIRYHRHVSNIVYAPIQDNLTHVHQTGVKHLYHNFDHNFFKLFATQNNQTGGRYQLSICTCDVIVMFNYLPGPELWSAYRGIYVGVLNEKYMGTESSLKSHGGWSTILSDGESGWVFHVFIAPLISLKLV